MVVPRTPNLETTSPQSRWVVLLVKILLILIILFTLPHLVKTRSILWLYYISIMSSLAATQADGMYIPPDYLESGAYKKKSLNQYANSKGHNQFLQRNVSMDIDILHSTQHLMIIPMLWYYCLTRFIITSIRHHIKRYVVSSYPLMGSAQTVTQLSEREHGSIHTKHM